MIQIAKEIAAKLVKRGVLISMLENAWYCAAWSHEIQTNGLLGRKLLNRQVVLFRDSKGKLHAVGAVCPHRGADLTRGRVVDDALQCSLHGWRFDSKGTCVAVPSQPASLKIPLTAKVPSYAVKEHQGVVWIWVGRQREDLPNPPQGDAGSEGRRLFNRPQLWKCTFVNAVENAIDVTHVPFVHVRTLGSNQEHLYPRQDILVDDDLRGFSGKNSEYSPWGSVRAAHTIGGTMGYIARRLLGLSSIKLEHYRFDLGGSLFYTIVWDTSKWDILIAHSTPADESHTWFFGESIRTRATHWLGDIAQKWFNRSLCKEDEAAITAMLSNDPTLLPTPTSVVGDEPLLTFRRIYSYHVREQQLADLQ